MNPSRERPRLDGRNAFRRPTASRCVQLSNFVRLVPSDLNAVASALATAKLANAEGISREGLATTAGAPGGSDRQAEKGLEKLAEPVNEAPESRAASQRAHGDASSAGRWQASAGTARKGAPAVRPNKKGRLSR